MLMGNLISSPAVIRAASMSCLVTVMGLFKRTNLHRLTIRMLSRLLILTGIVGWILQFRTATTSEVGLEYRLGTATEHFETRRCLIQVMTPGIRRSETSTETALWTWLSSTRPPPLA